MNYRPQTDQINNQPDSRSTTNRDITFICITSAHARQVSDVEDAERSIRQAGMCQYWRHDSNGISTPSVTVTVETRVNLTQSQVSVELRLRMK